MNTITHKLNGVTCIRMSDNVIRDLRSYSPQGCPFIGYTLYDLLQDLIGMYSWKIDRGYTILITEFIKQLQNQHIQIWSDDEGKIVYDGDYGDIPEGLDYAEVSSIDNIYADNKGVICLNIWSMD